MSRSARSLCMTAAHNAGGHSIHNHFIIKSLDLTRPGGLLAVVTSGSPWTLRADAARREMAERADLLGAVRLPAGTFRAASGTDVVTDVVILRSACRAKRTPASRGCPSPRSPPSTVRLSSTSISPPTPR